MTTKIIKHRLHTWFENTDNPVIPGGDKVRVERIAHLGDEVDINDEASLARGEELGAFYTDEEAKAIKDGTYDGPDLPHLERMRQGLKPPSEISAVDGEGVDTSSLSAEELGDYIRENRLNVDATIALAGDDTESIEKVLDAENFATDNDPRKGVTDHLEKKLADAASA